MEISIQSSFLPFTVQVPQHRTLFKALSETPPGSNGDRCKFLSFLLETADLLSPVTAFLNLRASIALSDSDTTILHSSPYLTL